MSKQVDEELDEFQTPPENADAVPVPIDAIEAVRRWSIQAVGRKPEYFMARDLQCGSLYRDPRPRTFHEYTKDFPFWLNEFIDQSRMKPGEMRNAQQLVCLMYLHARQLLLHVSATESLQDYTPDPTLIRRLLACPPMGLMVGKANGEEVDGRDVCQLGWLCPWCFTRIVLKIHKRLDALVDPEADVPDRYLLLGKATVFADQIALENSLPFGKDLIGWVRRHLGKRLRQTANRIGARDGLFVYQLGPHLSSEEDSPSSFRHELSILGMLRITSDSQLTEIRTAIGAEGTEAAGLTIDSLTISARWWLMPLNGLSLRMLLVGSSHGYPTENLFLSATSDPEGIFDACRDGIPGAFQLQPLFMLQPADWWNYVAATLDLRLYELYGGFRQSLSDVKAATPVAPEVTVHEVSAGSANMDRQKGALARLEDLKSKVRPHWQQTNAQSDKQPKKRGRPPVRMQLAQILKNQQIELTVWELRKVIDALRQEGSK